jgi:alpha-L-fucosidase
MFHDKSVIKFLENDFGITLKIPTAKMNEVDTVIELELK